MVITRVLVPGSGNGPLLILDEPLSLWGGVDIATGQIVEKGHPQHGEVVGGRILALPHGRGSSSSSSVLAELLRLGIGPSGIVLGAPDSILVIGALVARALYGAICPVVVTDATLDPTGIWEIDGDRLHPVAVLEKPAENTDT
jgi:predicted aconitase with swiveling domain